MSEPEEGRFRRSSNRSIDDLIPKSDTAVPAEALERAVPYLADRASASDPSYSSRGSASYRAKPSLNSKAHESLYANRASAPYRGSDFDGSFASAYGTDGAANHALSVYASAKQANPYR